MKYVIDASEIPWREAPLPLTRSGKVLHDGLKHPELAPLSMGLFRFNPGQYGAPHTHKEETEIFVTTAGTGKLIIDGQEYQVRPGTVAFVPPGIEHQPVNGGDVAWEFLAIFTPALGMDFVNDWKEC